MPVTQPPYSQPAQWSYPGYPAAKSSRQQWITRGVLIGSVAWLAILVLVMVMIYEVSESWWLGTVFTFLPRIPYLLPVLVLAGLSWKYHRKSLWTNAASAFLVLVPIMDLQLPWQSLLGGDPEGKRLKVLSCNVQGYEPDFSQIMREITQHKPDVIAFQEVYSDNEALEAYLSGWEMVRHEEYLVASRYPLKFLGACEVEAYERKSAISVEIDAPEGKFILHNVHLMTARRGLENMTPDDLASGSGQESVAIHQSLRDEEALLTREFISAAGFELPQLVVGDFNQPSHSHLFKRAWGDYTNAFETAGVGYGYTSPVSEHRFWLSNTPWLRIDHILASDEWEVESCEIGHSDGSDHRLITATLVRPAALRAK